VVRGRRLHRRDSDGDGATWLEHVTDEQYQDAAAAANPDTYEGV
jgi:hypothetical protein